MLLVKASGNSINKRRVIHGNILGGIFGMVARIFDTNSSDAYEYIMSSSHIIWISHIDCGAQQNRFKIA